MVQVIFARGSPAWTAAQTFSTSAPWAARPSSSKSRRMMRELGGGGGAGQLVDVEEALAAGGGLGGEGGLGEGVDDLRGEVEGVDELALGHAGVDRDALDADDGLVGGEALEDDLAALGAVEGVGDVGREVAREVGVDAAADLLVGGEGDADRAVRDLGVGEEVAGHGHDDGDAGLVVGAEERRAAGGDDVVALALGEVGGGLGREDEVGRVGEGDARRRRSARWTMRLDAGGVELRRGVDVGEEGDGGGGRGCRGGWRGRRRRG